MGFKKQTSLFPFIIICFITLTYVRNAGKMQPPLFFVHSLCLLNILFESDCAIKNHSLLLIPINFHNVNTPVAAIFRYTMYLFIDFKCRLSSKRWNMWTNFMIFFLFYFKTCSSSKAFCYGLHDLGVGEVEIFLHSFPVQTGSEVHSASYNMSTGDFPWGGEDGWA